MNWRWKTGLIVATVLAFGALLFVLYKQREEIKGLNARLDQKVDSPQETLDGGITRGEHITTGPGGAEEAAREAGVATDVIAKDANKRGQRIGGTGIIIVETPGAKDAGLDATTVAVTEAGTKESTLDLGEPFANLEKPVPWGRASYAEGSEHPWGVEIFPRKYQLVVVDTTDDDGNRSQYSKFSIGVGQDTFDLPISTAKFYQDKREDRLRWDFLPFLGIDVGAKANPPAALEITPVAQVSLLSYGKAKLLPTWTFANLGLGYATRLNSLMFVLTPLTYNIGEPLPFLNNLYIGPTFGIGLGGNVVLSLGARVEL